MKHAQRITWLVLGLLMASALPGCVREVKDTHPDQLLTKRKALFKQMNRALEPIGLVANERDVYDKQAFVGYVDELQNSPPSPGLFLRRMATTRLPAPSLRCGQKLPSLRRPKNNTRRWSPSSPKPRKRVTWKKSSPLWWT